MHVVLFAPIDTGQILYGFRRHVPRHAHKALGRFRRAHLCGVAEGLDLQHRQAVWLAMHEALFQLYVAVAKAALQQVDEAGKQLLEVKLS